MIEQEPGDRRKKLMIISNFSMAGRGTRVVSSTLLEHSSFVVLPFDVYENRLGPGPVGFLTSLLRLIRACWQERPDVILADTQIGLILAGLNQLFNPTSPPLVVRYGGIRKAPPPKRKLTKSTYKSWLSRNALDQARLIVVPSLSAKESFPISDQDKVVVIHNGLPQPLFQTPTWRADQPVSLMFVGRLDVRKSPFILLDALASLLSLSQTRFEVHFYGERSRLQAEIDEKVAALSLESNVFFHGFQTDLWQNIPCNPVLIHPAQTEGFGFSVLEAIQCGVPAVVFRGVGGPEEIIGETNGGLIVPVRSAEALATSLLDFLSDRPSLEARMTEASATARDKFDPLEMARRYDRQLASLTT